MLPGDFSATFEKDGLRVGVVGLNSTFLQFEGGDYRGRLALSAQQFHEACGSDGAAWARDHHVCLLLTHQPPDWLDAESRGQLDGEINVPGRFAVHVFGHMHEAFTRSVALGGAEPRREWQGCSLFGLEEWGEDEGKQERLHGYSAGRIEVEGDRGSIRQWPREATGHMSGHRHIVPHRAYTLEDDEGTRPENFVVTVISTAM